MRASACRLLDRGSVVLAGLTLVLGSGACRPTGDGAADTTGTARMADGVQRRTGAEGGGSAVRDRVVAAEMPVTPVAKGTDEAAPVGRESVESSAEPAPTMSALVEDRPGLVRLAPIGGLWIDPVRKEVVVAAKVVLTEGPIELFACPSRTKEYESLLAVDPLECRLDPPTIEVMASLLGVDRRAFNDRAGARLGPAELIHTALVLIGLEPGRPVVFLPEYQPATGSSVQVRVRFRRADESVEVVDAREWIRDIRTGGGLTSGWVFAGSSLSRDPDTGGDRYEADAGDLICVSNFQTAMLDLPVPSAQSNEALVFEVMPDRVPPKGTPVEIILSAGEPAVTDADPAPVP